MTLLRSRRALSLWFGVAVCCVLDAAAAYVFRLWHPHPFFWGGDFWAEALPPLKELAHGHLLTFLRTGPAYLGATILEATCALPGIWLGASNSEVYFLAAIPGIIAAPLLLGWLARRHEVTHLRLVDLPLALIVLNPVTLCCLANGHPEDILTTCLVIAAVAEAARGSDRAGAVLIVLAIAAKPWAVLAAPLVWSVAEDSRRACVISILGSAAFWAPVILIRMLSQGAGAASGTFAAGVGQIDAPQQFFYWLGADNWLSQEAHVLIPIAAGVLTLLWNRRRTADPQADRLTEALWLLAFLFLVRAAFDPWDNSYYHLPLLMTLMVLEARSRRRVPLLTILGSALAFILVSQGAASAADPVADARNYSAAAGVALIGLAVRVYAPQRWHRRIMESLPAFGRATPVQTGSQPVGFGPRVAEERPVFLAKDNFLN